jgi:hypothetical protein
MHNLYTAAGAVFYHKVVAPEGAKGGVETPSPKLMERIKRITQGDDVAAQGAL